MKLQLDKFILFGDSITQMSFSQQYGFGFGAALTDAYVRKLDVVNRGFSGYNSDHGKVLLPAILETEPNTKIMTLFFGTNDAALTFQHVPLDRYLENMTFMIKLILKNNIKLIVIGPGLHDSQLAQRNKPERGLFSSNKRAKLYSDNLKKLCQELHVPFIELWREFQLVSGYTEHDLLQENIESLSRFFHDGIHFTGESYQMLFDNVTRVIATEYPQLQPDNLKQKLPHHDEIDYENFKSHLESLLD